VVVQVVSDGGDDHAASVASDGGDDYAASVTVLAVVL
jgi:hypothetical protein